MARSAKWLSPKVVASAPEQVSGVVSIEGTLMSWVPKESIRIALNKGRDGGKRLALTQFIALASEIQLTPGQTVIGFVTDVTYELFKTRGCRMSIVAEISGTSCNYVDEFAPLKSPDVSVFRTMRWYSPLGVATAGAGILGKSGSVVPYDLSMMLCVQREAKVEEVRLSVDSIDVQAIIV